MPQFGQPLLSPFGKGTAGCEIRKFPSESHRISFAEVWVLPGGDGRSRTLWTLWIWGVLQTHRAECSAEAGPACANHAVFNRFFPLLMGFISTLETRLVFCCFLLQRFIFFNRMAASSTDSGMPAVIKDLEKTIHLMAYSG